MPEYPTADAVKHAGKYCATLAPLRYTLERSYIPQPSDDTGTVTFVRINGRHYALTAWHVPKAFKDAAHKADEMEKSFFIPQLKGVSLPAPFVRVPAPMIGAQKDIGIMPMDERVLDRIGKDAFPITDLKVPPFPLTHAVAVGFPTASKRDIVTERGTQLGLQCVHAIAEGITRADDADQVRFHSGIDQSPETRSLSGMSGGPVFWATANEFGLLGLTVEALDVTPIEGEENIYGGPRVNFICDRTTFEELSDWAEHAEKQWPIERERLNQEAGRRSQSS